MNYDIFTIFSKLRFRKTIKVINIHYNASVIDFTETSETASHKQDSIRKIIHAKVVNIPCVFETLLRAFHDLFPLISFHFQIWIISSGYPIEPHLKCDASSRWSYRPNSA